MPHSHTHVVLHVIFGTKNRAKLITPDMKKRLYPYMAGVVKELGGLAKAINGPEDHVHVLMSVPPTHSIGDVVRVLKTNSSRWIGEKDRAFRWQAGYAAFSVSESNVPNVMRYIDGQEEHHRTITFEEEYIAFLRRHGIQCDERFVWS